MKRILAFVLALILAAGLLPVGASAAKEDRAQIGKTLSSEYYRALSRSGKASLRGYCGLMTSWQLYLRGINSKLQVYNGNGHYDAYCDLEYTTGGYKVKAYSAEEYSLEQALNAACHNGTRDVYNIMVCFHATTTAAGSIYGHVLMIYAILDGQVYFNESFSTPMNNNPGQLAVCSVAEFADYYDPWTWFEGLVVFGKKEYADNCQEYASNLFAEAMGETALYSQPCTPESGEGDSQVIRSIAPGERLQVTALYENTLGQYYYRVRDLDTEGYVDARVLEPVRFIYEDMVLENGALPQNLKPGQKYTVSGSVHSQNSHILSLQAQILDAQGKTVMSYSVSKESGQYDLKKDLPQKALLFQNLEEGSYTFRLTAEGENHYIREDRILTCSDQACLANCGFVVSSDPQQQAAQPVSAETQLKEGWQWEQGNWYYYEAGTARTGWLRYHGLDYFLLPDGSAATGTVEINGELRYFTGTGAMRTGWMHTEQGTMYLLRNGEAAQHWHKLDRKLYYFDENGLLAQPGWLDLESGRYYLFSDGSAAVGWKTVDGANFYFGQDGAVLCLAIQSEGKYYISTYHHQSGHYAGRQLLTPEAIKQLKEKQ